MTLGLRSRALAGLLAILAMALVSSGCGSDAGAGSSGEARALLENAFAKGKAAKSGDLTLRLKADVQGVRWLDDPLELRLAGPYRSNGEKKLPGLDWDVHFDGAGLKLSGGVIATEDNAFLRFQGHSYELGEDAFARLARRLELTYPDRAGSPGQLGMDPASWLEDPKVEHGDPIGGEETRKVTGSVDVRKVMRDVVDLMSSPAFRKHLEREGRAAPEVPKPTDKDLEKIEDAIDRMDVELNVDRNDVLQRFFTEIDFNVRRGGDGKDVKGKLSFVYVLRKVGTNPVIRAPSNARPLKELLGGFGGLEESGTLPDAFGGKRK